MVTVLLLPGMDGTGSLLGPFVEALGADFQVKVVRYPTSEPLGYGELERIARAAIPEDGPFVLLGESFSGPIAVSLAAAQPERLKGVILCASFVSNPRPGLSALKTLVGVLPVALVPISVLCRILLGRHATADLRLALANALAQIAPAALRARLQAVLTLDVSTELAQVRVPVLYLRASQDRVVPPAAAKRVLRLCTHAKELVLAAPHFILQAVPSEAAGVVAGFIREVTAPAGNSVMDALHRSWQRACCTTGVKSDEDLFAQLVAAYQQPQRKYHTLEHLRECLARFEPVLDLAPHPGEVELALWFHDAVYEVRGQDNELQSAEWARRSALAGGASAESAGRIHALIMATRHDALPAGADEQLLVDVDLSILGAAPERFDEYEHQVQAEFAWVPGWMFRSKRRAILDGFLARPFIFHTAHFRAALESQARENLRRSIARLRS